MRPAEVVDSAHVPALMSATDAATRSGVPSWTEPRVRAPACIGRSPINVSTHVRPRDSGPKSMTRVL